MVSGVTANREIIDQAINDAAIDWTVARMPSVDRNLLRLATYELMFTDLPHAIIINEAVDLAKEYSTAGSGRFVNGVLSKLVETIRESTESDIADS